jgi:hypothetical protein
MNTANVALRFASITDMIFCSQQQLCRIIRHLGSGILRSGDKRRSPLFEIALVLVRFDHVASFIVNANRRVV